MRQAAFVLLGLAASSLLGGCSLLGQQSTAPRSTITLSCGSSAPIVGIADLYVTMPEPRTAAVTFIDPRDGAHSSVALHAGETCRMAPAP